MIETKAEDYKSHKHSYNVYVEINTKTKLGQNLLEQYRKQAQKQYIDIGRIGYHDEYGRYILDHYTVFELIAVPKLIIRVTERAVDKAGRDKYKLRTYMSKFGQLNFMLLVDRSCAELYLIEDVYIENLNHKEKYETLIYKLRYSSRDQVPLREIFYKFGIKANPDDYGKAWKKEATINNIIVAKAKAEMTITIANTLASNINQKALVTSLNYLNKEGTYGKSVTREYSKKVSKSKELNELSSSPKLENTLNNVLVKTLEQQTTRSDLKDKTNFILYKKVLDVELSSHNEIKKEVNKANNKQNLKEFLLDTYGKHSPTSENEEEINDKKFKTFEKIIEHQYSHKPNKELSKPIEEDFKIKVINVNKKENFFDFDNKKIDIDFNLDRFKKPVEESKKIAKKQEEKLQKKKEKKDLKLAKKINKNAKILNAECNLDEEFERSKQVLGILPTDSKKKKKKALKIYFGESNKKQKSSKEKNENNNEQPIEETNKLSIIEKIEKQIRSQKILQIKKTEEKKNKKLEKSLSKKNKGNVNNYFYLNETIQETINILSKYNDNDISIFDLENYKKQTNSLSKNKGKTKPSLLNRNKKSKSSEKAKNKKLNITNKTKKSGKLDKENLDNQTEQKAKQIINSSFNPDVTNEKSAKKGLQIVANNTSKQNIDKTTKTEILEDIEDKKKKKRINDLLLDDKKADKEPKQKTNENLEDKTNKSALNSAKTAESDKKLKTNSQSVSEGELIKNDIINRVTKENKSKTKKQETIEINTDLTEDTLNENKRSIVKKDLVYYDEAIEKTTTSQKATYKSNNQNASLTQNNFAPHKQEPTKKNKKQEDFGREM